MMLEKIGHQLANENLSDKELVDIVVPIPDSGNAFILFAEKIKKFEFGIIRNQYTTGHLYKIQIQSDT